MKKKTNRKRTKLRAARARTTAHQRTGAFVPPAPSNTSAAGAARGADRLDDALKRAAHKIIMCHKVATFYDHNSSDPAGVFAFSVREMLEATAEYFVAYMRSEGGTNSALSGDPRRE